ncbi:MAG TPA: hypothetical protein VFE53_03960 [Mucilaginibacter sp.]|jgi:hypothetical protein|nr:hypothetical protein [Mucilaginibacter sp.]
MKKFLLIIVVLCLAKITDAPINYAGDTMPNDTPQFFAPGILADGLSNRDFTISPSGGEIFFTIQYPKFISRTIIRPIKINGHWGKPEVAPFSGVYRDLEASFSPDGKTLFFSSDRPIEGARPKRDFDLWKVLRTPEGQWGTPENLGNTVNSDKNEFYPGVAKNGDLYFTVATPCRKGGEDIVLCKKNGAGYEPPISLPEDINTKIDEFNAFIDATGQFIIFTSYGRSDDIGKGDLHISHRDSNGNWMTVKHLPTPINSTSFDYCPYVAPDKKYFVFTSNRLRRECYSDKAAAPETALMIFIG